MKSTSKKAYFNNLRGGWCLDDLPMIASSQSREPMQLNQLSLAENIIIRPDGKVRNRNGFNYVTKSPTGSSITFAIGFGIYDEYAITINNQLWRYRRAGTGMGWTLILDPFTYTSAEVMNDKIYFFGNAEIGEFDPSTGLVTPIVGSTGMVNCHHVANDRLWIVQGATPMVVEGSAINDPTDWANGVANELTGDSTEIYALHGLDGELWIFARDAVWLQTGYGESSFTLQMFEPCKFNAGFSRSVVQVNLVGKGRAIAFVNDCGRIMCVNRSGIDEMTRGLGQILTLGSFVSAVFLSDPGILLISRAIPPAPTNDTSSIIAVFCKLPYRDSGGMVQWPATNFTFPFGIPFYVYRMVPYYAEGDRKVALLLGETSTVSPPAVPFPLFTFSEDDISGEYHHYDDYFPGLQTPDKPYWQVQGKLRLPPFNDGSSEHKTWNGFTMSVSNPAAFMTGTTQFTLTQYMDRTLQYPNVITAPATSQVWFDVCGYSEWTQIEVNLFGTSQPSAVAYNYLLEIHGMMLEFTP